MRVNEGMAFGLWAWQRFVWRAWQSNVDACYVRDDAQSSADSLLEEKMCVWHASRDYQRRGSRSQTKDEAKVGDLRLRRERVLVEGTPTQNKKLLCICV